MKNLITIVVHCFLATPGLHAGIAWENTVQRVTADRTRPEIAVEFPFINNGTTAVSIKEVSTSCGCTAAEMEKKTYAPGETGKVSITVRYMGDVSLVESDVFVTTDESTTAPHRLSVKVTVPMPSKKERIEVKPPYVSWKQGSAPTPQVVTLRIVDPDDTIRPTAATTPDAKFKLQLKSPRVDEPFVYELVITPQESSEPKETEIRVLTNWFPEEWPPGEAFSYRVTAAITKPQKAQQRTP